MITTILFDFDGVISNRFTTFSADGFCNKYGVDPAAFAEASKTASKGLDVGEITEDIFLQKLIDFLSLSATLEEVRNFFDASDIQHIEIRNDVIDIIKDLKKNFKVVLASNVSDGLSARLWKNGFYDVFDESERFFSFKIGYAKPSAEFFGAVLDTLGITPSEAFFVDDNAANVQGAIDLGIKATQFINVEELKKTLATVRT